MRSRWEGRARLHLGSDRNSGTLARLSDARSARCCDSGTLAQGRAGQWARAGSSSPPPGPARCLRRVGIVGTQRAQFLAPQRGMRRPRPQQRPVARRLAPGLQNAQPLLFRIHGSLASRDISRRWIVASPAPEPTATTIAPRRLGSDANPRTKTPTWAVRGNESTSSLSHISRRSPSLRSYASSVAPAQLSPDLEPGRRMTASADHRPAESAGRSFSGRSPG